MTDIAVRDVCKICFNASSQKANPTLTSEEKAINEGGRRVCPNCRQTWSGQKVAKDPDLNRWVLIRPRPLKMNPHIDYQLCTSVSKRQTCPKGLGLCTFAHSRAELNSWNRERYRESRPVPTGVLPNQIILCKHVIMDGVCPYGQRCVYAHSEEEKDRWIDDLVGSSRSSSVYAVNNTSPSEYYCPLCNIHCTGQRQYEEHLSGQRHRQIVAAQTPPAFQQAFYAPPPVYHTHSVMPPRLNPPPIMPSNRPMPDRIPANGFRLCTRVNTSRGCFFGMGCTFAHSDTELESWNQQVMQYRGQRIAAGSVQSYIQPSGSHGDLDEFEVESHAIAHDQVDFAQRVRTTVMFDYQDKEPDKVLCGFEKTVQSVTVTEVSGREEALTLSDNAVSVSWVFEVSATAPRTLQSVVLFDVLAPEYSIDAIELVMYGGHTKPIIPNASTNRGAGLFIAQRIAPPDKVNVKISFKPRSGVLGQMVIFDFGSFYMIRYLCVHVINEQDRRLLASHTHRRNRNNRPDKIDYFWEQTYAMSMVDMDTDDTVDERLPEHLLPKVIEDLIDKGKYDNMQRKVIKKNYVRRMHNLLYLEEFQEIKDLSRYDIYDVEMVPKDCYIIPGEIINDPRYSFVTLDMDEVLFEGGRSIRGGDHVMVLLRPSTTGQCVLHKCIVHSVMRDTVVLKMSKRTAEVCTLSGNIGSVRFQPSRVAMRAMHEALDKVDSNVLFPDMAEVEATTVSPALRTRLNGMVDHSSLNGDQKNAMHSILDPLYKKIPTLVLGPFGCGKTKTLCECAMLLSVHHPSARILICTHTNSAADIYVKMIHAEYARKHNEKAPMLRLYYSERRPQTVDPEVLQFCKMRNDRFYHVDASELEPYSVVVTTTITARMLWLNGVDRGYFTHILIDEAAQVLEAELLVALCLADEDTKIALAGDTMQMEPPVHSHYAKKYGLDISLLERLYNEDLYNTDLGMKCKIKLLENHRSHFDILHLPSKLFYDNKLLCKAVFPPDGPKQMPNLQFVGVDGHEAQDDQSPSYYNDDEVVKIGEEVTRFCNAGLAPEQVCVLSYYGLQMIRIRSYLRKMKFSKVEVHRIDGIQGREYRALIISTVRTCASTHTEDEDGFLNNVKFFNTAITRAKEWLVIVGEPITLCTVGYNTACWMELIEDCIQKKTFRYQCPDMFMKFLETRVISRQIMQKNHGEFLKKSTAHSQANKVIAPPIPSEPNDPPRPVVQQAPPTSHPSLSVAQQQQMVKITILKSMQTPDDAMATTIYGEVLKLNPQQLKVFMTQPESAANYVKELENAMKRGGLTSVLMNNARLQQPPSNPDTMHHLPLQQQKPVTNVSNMMGDLPSFLQAQVESLTQHLRFCEPQKCTNQESLRNLREQKNLLLQQMNLVNQQILKYREFVRLNTTQAVPSLVQSMSQLSTTNHTPLTSAVAQQRMMFGSASQTVGGAVPPTGNHQAFYRPDTYSSYHNSVPLLQQGLGVNVTSGGSNVSQQHSFNPYGINPTPAGYANNNIAGMMSQHAATVQQHPSAFNSMQSNTQQPSANLRTTFRDPFMHSQQSFRQTTQLISPLNDLAVSQTTWNGDADSD